MRSASERERRELEKAQRFAQRRAEKDAAKVAKQIARERPNPWKSVGLVFAASLMFPAVYLACVLVSALIVIGTRTLLLHP